MLFDEGDYPGLDKGRRSSYRWLRQAGTLVLVFVVGIAMLSKATGIAWAGRMAVEGEISTESGLSRPLCCIPVLNGSNEIQAQVIVPNFINLILSQSSPVADFAGTGDTARQGHVSSKLVSSRIARFVRLIVGRALREARDFWKDERDVIQVGNDPGGIPNVDYIQGHLDWLALP